MMLYVPRVDVIIRIITRRIIFIRVVITSRANTSTQIQLLEQAFNLFYRNPILHANPYK